MNHFRFSTLLYVVLLFALVACQAQVTATPAATQVPIANPLGEHVVAEWKINDPTTIVFGFDSAWVPSRGDSPNGPQPLETTRIDPVSNKISSVIAETGRRAKSAVVTANAIWISGQANDLAPIDPKTNTIGTRVTGDHPRIVYGFNSIWAVGHQGEPLDRIDPVTSQIIVSIPLSGTISDRGEENDILMTASAVWVIANGELIKVDPSTNRIAVRTTLDTVIAQAQAQTLSPTGKGLDFLWWVVPDPNNTRGCGLLRMEPNTGAGLTFKPVGYDCGSIAVTDNSVWLSGSNQIDRFNLSTNQIDATYKLQPGVSNLGIGFGSVWVVYEPIDLVQRLDIAP